MHTATETNETALITDHLEFLGYECHEPENGGWPFAYHETRSRFFYTSESGVIKILLCYAVGKRTSEQRGKILEWCNERNSRCGLVKFAIRNKETGDGEDVLNGNVMMLGGYSKSNFAFFMDCLDYELKFDDFPSLKD
jgi:hypothetical protein